ncbi:MAG: D-alanine--D-alanine ligase [Thiotrichales bacterium]|nr:D-alanine--D-alanine ligase [Thiotrichales bacterium]
MTDAFDRQDTARFGKVAVLLGGSSAEREISLLSGTAVLQALRDAGVDAHDFDPGTTPLTGLLSGGFDRAFIALHGRGGEDGQIQGALESLGIPYTGSGVLASALAMDKCLSKRLWQSYDLPTPDFLQLTADSQADAVIERLGLPLMIKPSREGSSLGASKVSSIQEFAPALEQALALDDSVLAEVWITGREYTVPVLNDRVLPMIRLETPREFYDYVAKYEADTTQYICPCGLSAQDEQRFAAIALEAFRVLDARGWGRVDLFVDDAGAAWLIEVNTVPGMTSHSLVPMSANHAGIDFAQLVLEILAGSLAQDGG